MERKIMECIISLCMYIRECSNNPMGWSNQNEVWLSDFGRSYLNTHTNITGNCQLLNKIDKRTKTVTYVHAFVRCL